MFSPLNALPKDLISSTHAKELERGLIGKALAEGERLADFLEEGFQKAYGYLPDFRREEDQALLGRQLYSSGTTLSSLCAERNAALPYPRELAEFNMTFGLGAQLLKGGSSAGEVLQFLESTVSLNPQRVGILLARRSIERAHPQPTGAASLFLDLLEAQERPQDAEALVNRLLAIPVTIQQTQALAVSCIELPIDWHHESKKGEAGLGEFSDYAFGLGWESYVEPLREVLTFHSSQDISVQVANRCQENGNDPDRILTAVAETVEKRAAPFFGR